MCFVCTLQVFEFGALHQRLELLLFLNGKNMEAHLSSLLVVGICGRLSHAWQQDQQAIDGFKNLLPDRMYVIP